MYNFLCFDKPDNGKLTDKLNVLKVRKFSIGSCQQSLTAKWPSTPFVPRGSNKFSAGIGLGATQRSVIVHGIGGKFLSFVAVLTFRQSRVMSNKTVRTCSFKNIIVKQA